MKPIAYTQHGLVNGLRVVLSEDHTAPIVYLQLCYGVGSANEVPGRTGFAHLFEHLMFQGSANAGKGEHVSAVQDCGGTFNGTTNTDLTRYFETVPSEYLESMLWLEADRMGRLLDAVNQDNLDNQREVVKNEKRQSVDNRPYGSAALSLRHLVFPDGHPYHHDVIGSMEDLDAATLTDVHSFFADWYGPDNCVLAICGHIDPDETMRMVEKHFGPLPSRAHVPATPPRDPLPVIGSPGSVTLKERVPGPAVYLAYRAPASPEPALDALNLMGTVLSASRVSRLRMRLVRNQHLAQNLGRLGFSGGVAGASLGFVNAIARPGVPIEDVESALIDEIARIAADGPTPSEMERTMAMAETGALQGTSRVSSRGSGLAAAAMLHGDPGLFEAHIRRRLELTAQDLRDAAKAWLRDDNRATLTYEPVP